jgi:hypothetical protein
VCRDEPERRIRLQHLVFGRSDTTDLEEVVHQRDVLETGTVRCGNDLRERRAEFRRAARPGEIRDL